MKNFTLVLAYFAAATAFAQTFTRMFPIEPISLTYMVGSSAPITPTPDNGYLLNWSYSYPNWDVAPGYVSTVIKTDANFVPLWSKRLPSGNGKKSIVLSDGSSIFFSDSGTLTKLDQDGQTVFSIGNFVAYPDRFRIDDAALVGNVIKAVGSKNTYNGFGYITTSIPMVIDFGLDGSVLQASQISGPATSVQSLRIFTDNSGQYYISGYHHQQGNYFAKMDASNNVLWCRNFRHVNPYSTISINDAVVLANGTIVLAGQFYNYGTSFASIFLFRLSADGSELPARTTTVYNGGLSAVTLMPNGSLVATGTVRENENSFPRSLVSRISPSLSVSWAKLYANGFATSAPFVKTADDWYFTAFHNNYETDNNPILFNTDSNGVTECPYTEIDVTLTDVALNFSAVNLTLTPNTTLLGTPSATDPYATQTQEYADACLPALSAEAVPAIDKLVVYPNPSRGEVRVVSQIQIKSVEVINTLGQVVLKTNPNQLETSVFLENGGIYLMKINTASGMKNVKIVISE